MRNTYQDLSLIVLVTDMQHKAGSDWHRSAVWARFEADSEFGNALLTSFALGGYPAAWQFVLAIAKEDSG